MDPDRRPTVGRVLGGVAAEDGHGEVLGGAAVGLGEQGIQLALFGLVGLGESREAANPFGKTKVPIDAYCALLIDKLDV